MVSRSQQAALDPALCRRCQNDVPTLTVRTEPLCAACFRKYVSTKIVKRMEAFRVRSSSYQNGDSPPTFLLPLSFGSGSTTLLHVLSVHLDGQRERTGRPGFRLCVVHVQDDVSKHADELSLTVELLRRVAARYPAHSYHMSKLSNICDTEDFRVLLSHANADVTASSISNQDTLIQLLNSLPSATARADTLTLLRRRLIVHIAKQYSASAILWGTSTTTLAETTLSEVAKGRGSTLPWLISDGPAPQGLPSHHPVSELLGKELLAFTSLVEPPLTDLLIPASASSASKPPVSAKNTTIDDLMKHYFASVEQEYPSVVANVVRTSGKLLVPTWDDVAMRCELCDLPLSAGSAPQKSRLCYGCVRSLPGELVG